ncbi:Cold-shock DEAD box protein A [Luteitalea pratensis]|uniref:DEAD-box ATP-dependent RNA helicase RhpA n=1 Tax=Luteitalea pratensis TaxID=1855912 RepID=A0A143PYL9_LUTPR|nr:DEAD/DEAH box helicase [Luteitalea pratensis]AMY12889.1 Cold-shock DEAD box protein A [Luteitalea pratensis]
MSTDPSSEAPTGFSSLGLSDALVSAVSALGYEEPTPIQREAIPVLLDGKDVLGMAGTGTGKTAAFALPMIELLSRKGAKSLAPRGLVLVPTRELAMQVAEALHKYARGTDLAVAPLYGGAPMDVQIRALRRGVSIVVATPGRALDHLRRHTLDLRALRIVVLDEADEMIDMGFAEDIESILANAPDERQTALFAATMAPRLESIASTHLTDPVRVAIAKEKRAAGKLPRIRQVAYLVPRQQKTAALGRVLDVETPSSAIVFCRTRTEVDELTDTLAAHGYGAKALHGGMEQKARDRVMQMFRTGQADVLVATDVAARGLDIEHVSHVVNYDLPMTPEVYVHRIGRTGRAGREGMAISLVDPRQHRQLRSIEGAVRSKIEILPIPTEADLQARRLDTTLAAVRAQIVEGGLEQARAVVDRLAQEFDVLDVAAAAIRLLHDDPAGTTTTKGKAKGGSKREAGEAAAGPSLDEAMAAAERRPAYSERPARGRDDEERPRRAREGKEGPPSRPSRAGGPRGAGGARAVLHINIGKAAGVRPADLVGAIAGEADVDSGVIGAIRIGEESSLVDVPEALATRIMISLRNAKVRGRRVMVRKDRGDRE